MQYDPDALVSEDQGRFRPGESAPDDVDLTLHRPLLYATGRAGKRNRPLVSCRRSNAP